MKKGRLYVTVVYMAQSKEIANSMQDLLSNEYFVKLRPINKP